MTAWLREELSKTAAAGLAIALLLPGCGKDPEPAAGAAPAAAASGSEAVRGRALFEAYCSPCHGPDGEGVQGGPPPLANSSWVAGSEGRLIRIVLHGVHGSLEVRGKTYDLEMPSFGPILTDEHLAGLLTWVRGRFSRSAPPVTAEAVGRVRAATSSRDAHWTGAELLEIE